MQKVLLSILLILAIFALPMLAQDEPKKEDPKKEEPKVEPKKEEPDKVDPKVAAETKAWMEIQEIMKKLQDRTMARAEWYKIYYTLFPAYEKYLNENWGVNVDNTKAAVTQTLKRYSSTRKYEDYLKLSAKCLKADFYEANYKMGMHINRAEMLINLAKFTEALEEIKDIKLKDAELTPQDQINAVMVLSVKARVFFKMKKMDEYKKILAQIALLRKDVKDDKASKYFRYYIMKINDMVVVEGTIAPNWKTIDFEGKAVELSKYKGKYVLLDFWATWCGPCRSAMEKHLKPMSEKYKGISDKFIIVSVGSSSRDTMEKQIAFVKKMGYKWDFVYDKEGTASESYGVMGIPTLVFVDPEGKIIFKGHGETSAKVSKFLDEKFKLSDKPKDEEPKEEAPKKEVPKKEKPKGENF